MKCPNSGVFVLDFVPTIRVVRGEAATDKGRTDGLLQLFVAAVQRF